MQSGVKYVRRNFLCGLQGREPSGLEDFNAQLRAWVWGVANQRVHGKTHEQVAAGWDAEQFRLQPNAGRPSYSYLDGELRKVARDAYVDWQGSRYSVPWPHAGKKCGCERWLGKWKCSTAASGSPFTPGRHGSTESGDLRSASPGHSGRPAKSRR